MGASESRSRFAATQPGQGRWLTAWWQVVVALLLAGCATAWQDVPEEQRREAASRQAMAVAQLLVAGDPGAVYDKYLSEGSRKVVKRDDFVAVLKRTVFRSAEVQGVECAAEVCKVTIRYTYDAQISPGIPYKGAGLMATQNWIWEGGEPRLIWSQ